MIRLWSRVGPFRALALLLLVGAVGGGALVAADRPAKRQATASSSNATTADAEREDPKQLADIEAERAEAERAARKDAQRKADEAAAAAAEQAKAVDKPSPSSSAKPGKSKPPVVVTPNLPIPASCNVYSGVKATFCSVLVSSGIGLDQMACAEKLVQKESGWNPTAKNKSTGAYGLGQALPAGKMADFGADYLTNPATQAKWMISYVKKYGSFCGAWAYWQNHNYY